MTTFNIQQHAAPFDLPIHAGGPHRKTLIASGTPLWVIECSGLFFSCAYLSAEQAQQVVANMDHSLSAAARRPMPLKTLLAWNFSTQFPDHIARPMGRSSSGPQEASNV